MSQRVEISKRLVLINSASSLAARFLQLSVLVWLQQYLLKRITPEEYQLLPLLYSVMMFAPLLTTILTAGLGRYITVAYARDDDDEVTRICSTMFPILCLAGLVFLALGWTLAWHIGKVLNIPADRLWDARIMMGLLMFSAAIRLPLAPFGVGFFVRQKFLLENVIRLATELLRLTLLFTLLFAISTRVLWVVTAGAAAELVNLAVTRAISMRLVPALRVRWARIHWGIAKEITSFGGWGFAIAAGNTIRAALDPILLNTYAGPLHVTCYHLATLPFEKMWSSIGIAKGMALPSLTAMHAASSPDRLRSAFLRGTRIALWVFLLPGLALFLFSSSIIHLYVGPRFDLAIPLLQMNFLAFGVLMPSAMFATVAQATARLRSFALCVVATHLLNLGLTVLFVVFLGYGALGSVFSTAIASAVFYPMFIWPLARRALDISTHRWLGESVWPGILPALVAMPAFLGLAFLVGTRTLSGLLIVLGIGSFIYVLGIYFCAARKDDRRDIMQTVGEARRLILAVFHRNTRTRNAEAEI